MLRTEVAESLPWDLIIKLSDDNNLEPSLVGACILTESSGNPWSMRYEPAFKYLYSPKVFAENLGITIETETICQKSSYGLMQMMGAIARELSFKGHLPELFDVELNLTIGCEKLKRLSQKYDTQKDVIAAYNAGSVRKTPGGLYVNQKHVDRFDSYLRKLENR